MQGEDTSSNLIREIEHWKFPWDKIFPGNNVANIHGNVQEEETWMLKAASLQ